MLLIIKLKKSFLVTIVYWPLLVLSEVDNKKVEEDDWTIALGAGVFYSSAVTGIASEKAQPIPLIEVSWKDTIFFDPMNGLGINVYQDNDLSLSFSMSSDFGRKENAHSRLDGLGDIGMSTVFSSEIKYSLGPLNSYIRASNFLDGTKGTTATIGSEIFFPLGLITGSISFDDIKNLEDAPPLSALLFSVNSHWGDEKHNQGYWGVTSKQANDSVYDKYNIGSGLNGWEATIGVLTPLSNQWSLMLNLNHYEMLGDSSNSPIINQKSNNSLGMIFRYEF